MNRLTSLLLLSLILFFSCQSESPPPKVEKPIPIPEELSFQNIESGASGTWVSQASLDQAIYGSKINTEPGKGILLLDSSKPDGKEFTSEFTHGDIEIDLEFMLTQGAQASIDFQGIHSLNLIDSWNIKELNANTLGSLGESFAPQINTALAPGLWQKLRVLYHSAREGQEIGAVFQKVLINGMLVQEEVEMSDIVSAGSAPLKIQASQGAIAIRNLSYKLYGDELPSLDSLTYEFYTLTSKTTAEDFIPDFSKMEAEASGQTDSLTKNVTEEKRNFGLVFEGKFNAPANGDYLFEVRVQGGAILLIDGKEVVNHDGETNYEEGAAFGSVNLSKGSHAFTYLYRKEHMQWRQGLGLFVEGPGVEKMALHSEGSVNPPRKYEAYELEAEPGSSLHRSYLMHKGKKLTHAISIGSESGLHYSYDLDNASLLQMWGGKFLDVRQMWVGRGAQQLAVPMGASIVHAANPNIALLKNNKEVWPTVLEEGGKINYRGYDISPNGEPMFKYGVGDGELTDHITTLEGARSLARKLSLEGNAGEDAYVLLAKGDKIHQGPDEMYGVDAFNYYLKMDQTDSKPFIRDVADGQELLISLSPNSSISYTLTW